MAESQFVVMQIGQEHYGADVRQVKSIEHMHHISTTVDGPDFVKGVLNLHGEIVPVIELRARISGVFGQSGISETEGRIVVVEVRDIIVGMRVDAIEDVVTMDDTFISSMPTLFEAFQARYLHGVAKLEDNLLILLNLEAVLSETELLELKAMEWETTFSK